MSVVIFNREHRVLYSCLAGHVTRLIRKNFQVEDESMGEDFISSIFSPIMTTASVLQEDGDFLEYVDYYGMKVNFTYYCEYTILLLEKSSHITQDILEEISILLVKQLRLVFGPNLDAVQQSAFRTKMDHLVHGILSSSSSEDSNDDIYNHRQSQTYMERRKFNGYTECAIIDDKGEDWWKERLSNILHNIKVNKNKGQVFPNIHLIVFDENMKYLWKSTLNEDDFSSHRLPLYEIQVYMRAKYLVTPLSDGGLICGWETDLDLIYLWGHTPSIAWTIQVEDIYIVMIFQINIPKIMISLLKVISGILFLNKDQWLELRSILCDKAISSSSLRSSVQSLTASESRVNLVTVYHQLVRELTTVSSLWFNKFRKTDATFIKPLERFVRIKLKNPPAVDLTRCVDFLRSSLPGILEVQVYNEGLRRFAIVPVKEDVSTLLLIESRPLFASCTSLCETDLEESDRHQIFRLNFTKENLPKAQKVREKMPRLAHFSIVAFFEKGIRRDVGQMSLLFVKFFSDYLSNSLT